MLCPDNFHCYLVHFMLIILSFFIAHWFLSLFFQTFFQHRYASHRMFTTNRFWERVFYLFAYLFEGASFLNPRAYALMHRAHHAYSDTEQDPHSPHFFVDVYQMMKATIITFSDYVKRVKDPEEQFPGHYPEWPLIDRMGSSILSRLLFGAIYTTFYIFFAPYWWLFLLLPIHFMMGPSTVRLSIGAGINTAIPTSTISINPRISRPSTF
jgi:stearoyl-CoA desaturase (delta-9 desaturase)